MKRYKMEAVVRYDDQDIVYARPIRSNITAPNEIVARRAMLERAWGQQMLVARIDVLDVVEV